MNSPRQPARAPRQATAGASHRVRIIGGRWKRTPIPVPDGEGLRPTPDRVRETLFNWLGQELDGLDCLDLFAGSGALSFEAASRGAARVVCLDRSRGAITSIRTLAAKLGATMLVPICGDALAHAERAARDGERFDLVFLDPPFRDQWIERCLPLAVRLLRPGGRIYVEAEHDINELAIGNGLTVSRHDRAGQVHYHLLSFPAADGSGSDPLSGSQPT
ncbi:16S rRNA (guanine(966)-N(2))-methyltransferase RsmD [Derxia gummosa]|uniref:16S rRNA (Guanine(966)-N(2))-methyltransferase RsmD n=1 Tax=Derxia gummosa DSM 723 TaxID=1121388 RepID=A0A8B6X7R7_9BURK|nr:16S rRNA (guanine(966)-N(2))-methyltransferase RsmD [Derxia gummosa]